jgi:hypothetical protein
MTAGPRWQSQGAISSGSTFVLVVTVLRPLAGTQELFDLALSSFLSFGTIGLRATRGLGAFSCKEAYTWSSQIQSLTEKGFGIALRKNPSEFPSWESALQDWSAWLRYKLRKENKADRFSALGGITPARQASAVRFRPIKLPNGNFTWLALEAPHGRVLGRTCSNILTPTVFEGVAPAPLPTKRRY